MTDNDRIAWAASERARAEAGLPATVAARREPSPDTGAGTPPVVKPWQCQKCDIDIYAATKA